MNLKFWNKKPVEDKQVQPAKRKSYVDVFSYYDINNLNKSASNLATTWVDVACHVRAEKVSSGQIILYQSSGKKVVEIPNHPFIDLVKSSNIYDQSFKDILYLISYSLDVYGKSFVYVVPSTKGQPNSFIFLNTPNVFVVLDKTGQQIDHYDYYSNGYGAGNKTVYSKDEILFFRIPSMISPAWGTPTIDSCREMIPIDNYRQMLQKRFLLSGGNINMILTADEALDDEEMERLKNTLRQRQNIDNTDSFLILQDGMKTDQVRSTAKELDYVKSSESVRDEILGKMRVPKTIVGITSSVNKATASAELFTFLDNTIKPFAGRIIDKLNNWIKKTYGNSFFCTIEFEMPNDPLDDAKLYEMLGKPVDPNAPITMSEVREHFGYSSDKPVNQNLGN